MNSPLIKCTNRNGCRVLNVQGDKEMLRNTLNQIKLVNDPKGRALLDYPKTPRYLDMHPVEVENQLKLRWKKVERIGGTKEEPIWEVSGDKPGWIEVETMANQVDTPAALQYGMSITKKNKKVMEEELTR